MIEKLAKKIYIIFILLILLVISGFYLSSKLPVDIFPNLNYPLFNIITHYPGGSPKDIEILITRPIESQLSGLLNIRRVSSSSREGLSEVTVEFDWGTDVKNARQLVLQAIAKVINNLPEGSKPTIENIGSTLQNIIGYGVTADKSIDPLNLKYLIKTKIVNHLKSAKGVSRIEMIGGEDKTYIVQPNILTLMKYGISIKEIKSVIEKNNYQVVSGYFQKSSKDYAIRCLGNIKNINDIKRIVVKKIGNYSLLLKDVAIVKNGSLPKRYAVYIDGKPGLAFAIFKSQYANTLKVTSEIKKRIKSLKQNLPTGISIKKYYDQSELIQEAYNSIKSNILIGGILVIIILLLFLGRVKDSILISLSIPVIIFISLIFFHLGKLSLNMITLGALAVAIGMIVDDSIIVLENILRHRQKGEKPLTAAISGTKEIRAADISGTLTTVAAFIPFIFLSGIAGRFAVPFGLVIIIALLLSLIISLTVIPIWLSRDKNNKFKPAPASKVVNKFIQFNQKILNIFLKHKRKVVLITVLVFLISGALLVFSPISFIPQVDEGAILLEYTMPPGTSLKESNKVGNILEKIILKNKNVYTVYRRTGSESGTYQVEPVNLGELVIKLLPLNKRKEGIFKIMKDLKKDTDNIPGIITIYHLVTAEKMDESFSGLPTVFGIIIYGSDYEKLQYYADKVEKIAANTPGFGNIVNNTKYKVPEIRIIPRHNKLIQYGLSTKKVMEEVRLYIGGEKVSSVLEKERVIPIFIRANKKSIVTNIDSIKNIPIKIAKNKYVPLYNIAKISKYYGASTITHINLQREVTLPAEINGSIKSAANKLLKNIKKLNLPEGYSIEFGGQYQTIMNMVKQFIFFAIISILIIYLIMSIQFGNYIHPLAIMSELPFSFIGAFLAIAISRQEVNLSFFIGLITLIGVSVNNGIVLIDYINKKREQGMTREKAIMESTLVRTRPILLTAITSILALFPLSLGLGVGSKIQQSLAIALIGGLSVNTILTLNVLPVIYCLVEDGFEKIKSFSKKLF